jgi:gliding motility-associated-like protein
MIKRFWVLLFFLQSTSLFCLKAQKLSPYVIASGGAYGVAGGYSLSATIGEPMGTTIGDSTTILTQGFQQPSVFSGYTLQLQTQSFNATCKSTRDGYAVVTVLNGTPPYSYSWSPSGGNKDTSDYLLPGTYTVFATDLMGNSGFATVKIMAELSDDCNIYIYKGITPNNDGANDSWVIDGIVQFPENKVTIFNRWGDKVWNGNGYDNTTVVWNGQNNIGNPLPDGSYFYIVEIPELDTFKGWVQLTR